MTFAWMRLLQDDRQCASPGSHAIVLWSTSAFRCYPGDDLVRIDDVACLAMNAVRGVDLQLPADRVRDHFVDVGGTETLAGVDIFLRADRVAHLGVYEEMPRLILVVTGARIVHVGH